MTAFSNIGGALFKVAFWVSLTVCLVAAFIPDPSGIAASFGGAVAHAVAFAYLAFILFLAHYRNGPALAVALWMFAFGVLIEVGQLFVAGRSGDFLDLAVDAIGISLGCAAYYGCTRGKVSLL